MSQVQLARESLVTIMGARGSGKTTLAKSLLALWPVERTFIYDPLNEFPQYEPHYQIDSAVAALSDDFEVVRFVGDSEDCGNLLTVVRELDNILVVFDEADMVLRASSLQNPEPFRWMVSYGRHFGQGMLLIARRPQELPRQFTAQSILFFSATHEPTDRTYIRQRVGHIPDGPGEYEWYAHTLAGELIHFPAAWARG